MDTNEIKKMSEELKQEILDVVWKAESEIKDSQDWGDVLKTTKEQAKESQKKFEENVLEIILLWYLIWYRRIDKEATVLPDEHRKIAETYADEIIQTYSVRMSQLIQNAIVYKSSQKTLKLLWRIDKDISNLTKSKLVPKDIGIKFAGRTVSLENYTKMIVNTAEQTSMVNATVNKGIQDSIMKYVRVERLDKKTCKVCLARNWEIWDVSKQGIPPALFHPFCRWYWQPII